MAASGRERVPSVAYLAVWSPLEVVQIDRVDSERADWLPAVWREEADRVLAVGTLGERHHRAIARKVETLAHLAGQQRVRADKMSNRQKQRRSRSHARWGVGSDARTCFGKRM